MTRTTAALSFAALTLAISGCSKTREEPDIVEYIAAAPTTFVVEAQGSLHSVKSTPLTVPGQPWPQRQLVWMVEDGSRVKQGDLIARFSADQSNQQLQTALVELQRVALMRAAKLGLLRDTQDQLEVDLSQVAGLLAIAHRYASAPQNALARNAILDAVQDEHYLGIKQDTLQWRKGQSTVRGRAELALIDAQRATFDNQVKDRRKDLDALEIRAPHAGLVVLQADWSGQKPHVGVSLFGGNSFAILPDTHNMEVELSLPQVQAQGIKGGMSVKLAPLGAPAQSVVSKIYWIAAAAAQRSSESPVKYLSLKASVPASAIERYRWTPGQLFQAQVVLLQTDAAISVPNIAVETRGEASEVQVREHGDWIVRGVRLGIRGPSRSQVLEGLNPGDEIVLNRAAAGSGSRTFTKNGEARKAVTTEAPP